MAPKLQKVLMVDDDSPPTPVFNADNRMTMTVIWMPIFDQIIKALQFEPL